ncbi:MAG: O-antigen ligase family protein [Acidobacteriia bacterium]|nr:O-antigen ligase family protein [Terriglobia bacterium]
MDRVKWSVMLLAAILFLGILTLWVPARWALTTFQLAIFASAAVHIVRSKRIALHPTMVLLGAAVVWGLIQAFAGWSVDRLKTLNEVLNWTTYLAVFSLGLELARARQRRERFLSALLWFGTALAAVSMLTVFSSPEGVVFWLFHAGSDRRTLGPFVYYNQYAAFIEAVLPLALVRAILDQRRRMLYSVIGALLLASVVAGGSRAGTILCLVEVVVIPMIALGQGLISRRAAGRVLLASVSTLVVLGAVAGWDVIWKRLQEPNAYALRKDLLLSSLEMVRNRPLTGWGLGTWPEVYPGFARFDDGLFANQAHNDWAQWAAEGGIPFLLLMMGAVAGAVRPAFRSLWGLGLLAVFVHCLVDYPMQQRPALAAFFFALLGIVTGSGAPSLDRDLSRP